MNAPESPLASDSQLPDSSPEEEAGTESLGDPAPEEPGGPAEGGGFVFSGTGVLSPIDELEQVVERKRRALEGRDLSSQTARLGRAHDLARHKLEEALNSSDGIAPLGRGDVEPC